MHFCFLWTISCVSRAYGLELREVFFDESEEHSGELVDERPGADCFCGQRGVDGVLGEVLGFFFEGVFDLDLLLDVVLAAALDADEAEPERDFFVEEHGGGVCAFVHDVDFGDDSERALAFGVELHGELERLRGGHVGVARDDCEDDGLGVLAVGGDHVLGDLLDVLRLVSVGDARDAGQVDDREVRAVRRVDGEHLAESRLRSGRR